MIKPEEAGMDEQEIINEAKKYGVDMTDQSDEMVAKFAYCVSERILAGDPVKQAIAKCLVEIRHMI